LLLSILFFMSYLYNLYYEKENMMGDNLLQDCEGFNHFTNIKDVKQQVEKMRKQSTPITTSPSSLQPDKEKITSKKKVIVPNEL
jgi:hypothetical protein